jgi:hypothetical protein
MKVEITQPVVAVLFEVTYTLAETQKGPLTGDRGREQSFRTA